MRIGARPGSAGGTTRRGSVAEGGGGPRPKNAYLGRRADRRPGGQDGHPGAREEARGGAGGGGRRTWERPAGAAGGRHRSRGAAAPNQSEARGGAGGPAPVSKGTGESAPRSAPWPIAEASSARNRRSPGLGLPALHAGLAPAGFCGRVEGVTTSPVHLRPPPASQKGAYLAAWKFRTAVLSALRSANRRLRREEGGRGPAGAGGQGEETGVSAGRRAQRGEPGPRRSREGWAPFRVAVGGGPRVGRGPARSDDRGEQAVSSRGGFWSSVGIGAGASAWRRLVGRAIRGGRADFSKSLLTAGQVREGAGPRSRRGPGGGRKVTPRTRSGQRAGAFVARGRGVVAGAPAVGRRKPASTKPRFSRPGKALRARRAEPAISAVGAELRPDVVGDGKPRARRFTSSVEEDAERLLGGLRFAAIPAGRLGRPPRAAEPAKK